MGKSKEMGLLEKVSRDKGRKWNVQRCCPLCEQSEFKLLGVYREHIGLCKCQDCGIIFLNPRPPQVIYRKGHLEKSYLPSMIKSKLIDESYTPCMKNIYQRYRKIADMAKKYYQNGEVLDVGCGVGLSMLALKYLGIESKGIDVDKNFLNFAKNRFHLNVECRDIFSISHMDKAKLATMNSVLEHIEDPVGFLTAVRKHVLEIGGILILTVPNINSLEFVSTGGEWSNLNGGHLWYFNESSLEMVANKAGFHVLEYYRKPDEKDDRISPVLKHLQTYAQDVLEVSTNLTGGIGVALISCVD